MKSCFERGAFTETSPALRTTVYVSLTARKCARQTSCVPRRPPRGQKSAPLACLWRWFEKKGGHRKGGNRIPGDVRSSLDQGQGRRDAAWCRRSRPLSRSPALYVRADPRLQHVVVTPQICRPGQGSAREPSQRIENFFHCIRVTDDLPGRKSDVRAATMAQRDTSLLPTLLW